MLDEGEQVRFEEADRIVEQVNKQIHEGTDSGYCVIHVDAAEPIDAKEMKK